MNQLRNDWLAVYADHRVIFTYPKFVDAIGAYIDYIGFVDLYPEPTRLYLIWRYKEPPPSMEGDLYLQRFPPLDVQIWGQSRRVDVNGNIGEKIGELKLLGTITIFCSTARELNIQTVYDQFAPRVVQDVIITLGKNINACIDDANAHPKPITTSTNEDNREKVSNQTILDETVPALPAYVTKVVSDFFIFNSRVPLGLGADCWQVEIEHKGANDVNFLNINGTWISIGARAFWQESEKEFRADIHPVTVGHVNIMPQTFEKSRVEVVCKWQSDDGFVRLFRKLGAHILEKTDSKRCAQEWRLQQIWTELPKRDTRAPTKSKIELDVNGENKPTLREEPSAAKEQATRKGGRPRNTDDDWAWEQVNRLQRDRTTVYGEWRERIGERAKMLADPQDSFNKAVSARRKEKTEKTE